jgi:hypothetical protein
MMARNNVVRLTLKCLEPEQCSVVLEPYGSEVTLAADDALEIEIWRSAEEPVEVAYSPGCITIWIGPSTTSVRATDRMSQPVDLGLPF